MALTFKDVITHYGTTECSRSDSRQNPDSKECVVVFLMTHGMKDPGEGRSGNRASPIQGRFVVGVVPEVIILVIRSLLLQLCLICSGNAAELLRDKHADTTYIFKSDAKNVTAKISRKEAILKADDWATGFYGDALFHFVACQFETKPIPHWVVTFQDADTDQQYYAVILPDGRVVMPSVERGLRS